jgi:hypothetical protein
MALPNPDHDQPHRDARSGDTVDKVDQLGTPVLFGLAALGAVAIAAINLAIG